MTDPSQTPKANSCSAFIYVKTTLCGGPAASLQYTVSLVNWVNRLLPTQGGSCSPLGDAPTLSGTGFSCQRCLATLVTLLTTLVIDHEASQGHCAGIVKFHWAAALTM
jgi:hypothetical protein